MATSPITFDLKDIAPPPEAGAPITFSMDDIAGPPTAAPAVHTDSGFGPPQVFGGVKSASPVTAAQGAFGDYNSRWKPRTPTEPPPSVTLGSTVKPGPGPVWQKPRTAPPGVSDEMLPPLSAPPAAPVKQEGPGWKDVEIGARQGAASAMGMLTRPSDSIYGGRTASGRPLSDVVEGDIAPDPRDVAARQSVGSKIIQGVSRAPFDVAKYAATTAAAGGNPILGMAAADAMEASGPRSTPEESIRAGVQGAAMGGVMEGLAPLSRAQRIPAGAAIGAGMTAMGGGSPEDIAASGVVMGALSGLHGKRAEERVEPKVEERPAVEGSSPSEPEPKSEPVTFTAEDIATPEALTPAQQIAANRKLIAAKQRQLKAIERKAAMPAPAEAPPAELTDEQKIAANQERIKAIEETLAKNPPPEAAAQPQPRHLEEVQRLIDERENQLIKGGADPDRMYDRGDPDGELLGRTGSHQPRPDDLTALYRERRGIEQRQDADVNGAISERLAGVIPDPATRMAFVRRVAETDVARSLREPDETVALGIAADHALQFAASEAGDMGRMKVDAITLDDPNGGLGMALRAKLFPGESGYSSATIARAQHILDAMMEGRAPRIPNGREATTEHTSPRLEAAKNPPLEAAAEPVTFTAEDIAAAEARQPGEPVVMGMGLGALQPHFDAAVATLKGDVEATKALIAKRDVALAALKAAQSTPTEKDAGQKILQYFTGERDVWGARMNQVMEKLRKVVPDHTEQEGLSLMRDFKSKPGELQQWLAGTHPTLLGIKDPALLKVAQDRIKQMRPAIEKALNPTPGMMAADGVLTNIAELSLLEGRKRGFLESNISSDEYVTHLLHPPELADFRPLSEKAGSLMGGKIGRRFAFSETRQYPTLLDAVAANQKPRTLNALTAFTIHADKFATSRATALLVDQLKKTGVGKWGVGTSKIPDGWTEIAPHAHPFQNTINTLSQAGDPTSMQQKLYVPKFIEEALKPITDPDFTNKIAGYMPLRQWQAWTKSIQLGLSAFHATAMNYMAAANMGAKGLAKGWMADRDSTAFLDGERRFIAHGGTTSIQGKTFEAYKSLEPGSIPGWGDILQRAPGIRQADQVANKITEFTFGKLQRQFKVTDFALKEAAWTAKNPTASAAQKAAALQSIAKEINAVYGGLHWENLGVNRTTLSIARTLMLAPDWTLSNLFNVKTALQKGPGGNAARMFWTRQVVGGLAATQAMSLMLSGKLSKRPTDVYMGTDNQGQEIYQNMFFKGASGDLITLVKNASTLGPFEGTAKTLIGKAAPGIRTALQMGFNKGWDGQEIIKKGTDFIPATVRGGGIAALDLAPLPLSGGSLYKMATDAHADQRKPIEFATVPFVGMPPAHVPPDGLRMTPQGLKVKKETPSKPWMDQIFNRKGPPPVRLGR